MASDQETTLSDEPEADLELAIAARSNAGKRRSRNEDAVLSERGDSGALLAVADGMGGHADGAVASQAAIEALVDAYRRNELSDRDLMAEAIEAADRNVRAQAAGGGTTVVLVSIDTSAASAIIAHVGDSRAYVLRSGVLTRLTDDHSLVQSLIDDGRLNEEEARSHPRRNVLLRALGGEKRAMPDVTAMRLYPNDVLLLCSDGLHGTIEDSEISTTITHAGSLDEAADRLISAALSAGGPDNVSVILCAITSVRG